MAEVLESEMIEIEKPFRKLPSDLLSAIQRWPQFMAWT